MTTMVEARGLCAGYAGIPAIHDLDLVVSEGELVVLLGANGAGKTTTVMTLAGALAPLAGEVSIAGTPTTATLHKRVQMGLSLVPEDRSIIRCLTVAENLRLARADSKTALSLFPELTPHLRRRAGLLSGGQQQMLSLARALARQPNTLLVDELSLGLAPQLVHRLLVAVRAAADRGIAVLLVEQHAHQSLRIADRGYVLQRGRIRLAETAEALRRDFTEIQKLYLSATASDASADER